MFVPAPCSVFVHSVAEESVPDPLTQLPLLLHACCSVPLQCTVLQRSQRLIPLAQLPMFVLLFAAFLLRCKTVLQRSQHSDPLAQLPMFAMRFLQRSFQCTVLQRSQHLILCTAAHVCLLL
jgi:hypothetical protein